MEFMLPLQRRCLPTPPPEDVTSTDSSLKTCRHSELCLNIYISLYWKWKVLTLFYANVLYMCNFI